MSPIPPPFLRPWFNVVTMHMINESQALSFRSPPPASTDTDDLVKLLPLSPQSISSPAAAAAEQACWSSPLLVSRKVTKTKFKIVIKIRIYIIKYIAINTQERIAKFHQSANFNFNNNDQRCENVSWSFYISILLLHDFMIIVTTRKFKIIQCIKISNN